MKLLFGHDDTVWQWANGFFETPLVRPSWGVGIINKGGVLQGAALGYEKNEQTVELALASLDAVTPKIAKDFLATIFAKYWRLEIKTQKDNRVVKRNAPKWGFTFEGTARDYYGPGHSALCYRMLREDWEKKHHVRKQAESRT